MISVVVPSFNEEEGIEPFLKSLCDQTLPRDQYEIIVVDGNSKDKTREIAEKYADKVFIQTSKKVGGARNDGVLASKYDLIVTTDADCFLPRPWLETIVKDFEKYPDASVIYGPIYPLEPGFKHKFEVFLYNIVVRIGEERGSSTRRLEQTRPFGRTSSSRQGCIRSAMPETTGNSPNA